MIKQYCKICKTVFYAKEADLKRGWAKCCSKKCAAILRESKKSNNNNFRKVYFAEDYLETDEGFLPFTDENMEF